MRAGQLRHRVTIQQKIISQNSFGEEVVTWSDVATVWAAVEPLRGQEFIEARQAEAEITARIRMRYRSDVRPDMRVVWGTHTYDVLAVIDVAGRGRELQLMCREIVA